MGNSRVKKKNILHVLKSTMVVIRKPPTNLRLPPLSNTPQGNNHSKSDFKVPLTLETFSKIDELSKTNKSFRSTAKSTLFLTKKKKKRYNHSKDGNLLDDITLKEQLKN